MTEPCLVSVIIPVYNVERYLTECVSSVLSQAYRNIEVILVDDGSTDGSPALCDEFARQDGRVSVMHKKNGGLSEARNSGVDMAQGKYVIFVDSDDFWGSESVVGSLVERFESAPADCDFIVFNMRYFYQRDGDFRDCGAYTAELVAESPKKAKVQAMIRAGLFPMSACTKIVKKSFLDANGIRFIPGLYSEDIPWFMELVDKSANFRFANDYHYVYRKQVAGTISSTFSQKKYDDLYGIVLAGIERVSALADAEMRAPLFSFLAYEYCILLGMARNFGKTERAERLAALASLRWLMSYAMHPKVRKVNLLLKFAPLPVASFVLYIYIKRFVIR